mgnify:CR=1 FL=1
MRILYPTRVTFLFCVSLGLVGIATAQDPTPPEVTNVDVTFRGNYVDISYDLAQAEGLPCVVGAKLSKDGGLTYAFQVCTVSGDVGVVDPGIAKSFTWNAYADYPDDEIQEAGIRLEALALPMDGLTIILPGDVPLELVSIPPGRFMMGRYPDEQDSNPDEDPQHSVMVSGFLMTKYVVTKRQWEAVMETTPWSGESGVLDDPDSPAVSVSWNDVQDFITALNTLTGLWFRLPTEAQWEYACRAGTMTRFYWGEDPGYTAINDYAWYFGNNEGNYGHVVGRLLPNAFDLYDMSGNVWEMCEDDWHPDYHGAPATGKAWLDSPRSSLRVQRGGRAGVAGWDCRSARRNSLSATHNGANLGFRLAL